MPPRPAGTKLFPSSIPANLSQIQIPLEHTTLKEFHQGTNGRLIIHIQDAHSNLSGQKSLAGALDQMISRYGISLVLVEGSSTDVTLDELKKIGTRDQWKRAANRLLYEGLISGEEYLNLTSDHPIRLMGIESQDLYDASLETYADLVAKRLKTLNYLRRIRLALDRVKNKLYPRQLLAYEAGRAEGEEDFNLRVGRLLELADASQVTLGEAFAEIAKLKGLRAREKRIDFDAANREQEQLMQVVLRGKDEESKKSFLEAGRRARTQPVAMAAYLRGLWSAAEASGASRENYPALTEYAGYLEAFGLLKMDALLEELDLLEDTVYKTALADSEDGRMTRACDRFVGLLQKAYQIKMSSSEFASLKLNEKDFSTKLILGFINRKLLDLGFTEDLTPYQSPIEDARASLEKFYTLVDQRDRAFLEKSEKDFADLNQTSAFFISGGYHTEHLTRLWRQQGYSYLVLTPVVTYETDQTQYEDLLLAPLKLAHKRLAGKNGEEAEAIRIARDMTAQKNVDGVRKTSALETAQTLGARFAKALSISFSDKQTEALMSLAARLATAEAEGRSTEKDTKLTLDNDGDLVDFKNKLVEELKERIGQTITITTEDGVVMEFEFMRFDNDYFPNILFSTNHKESIYIRQIARVQFDGSSESAKSAAPSQTAEIRQPEPMEVGGRFNISDEMIDSSSRFMVTQTEEAIRWNGKTYVVWRSGENAGNILQILETPSKEMLSGLPSMDAIYRRIDAGLDEIYRIQTAYREAYKAFNQLNGEVSNLTKEDEYKKGAMIQAREEARNNFSIKSEELSAAKTAFLMELHKIYQGDENSIGLREAVYYDPGYANFVQSIQSKGLKLWLQTRGRTNKLENLDMGEGMTDSREQKAFNEYYYGRPDGPSRVPFYEKDQPILTHGTYSNVLPDVLNLGGLASTEYFRDKGLIKKTGEGAGSYTPQSVSFWFYKDGGAIIEGGYGTQKGFELPIVFGISRQKMKSIEARGIDIHAGTMANEKTISGFVPMSDISHLYVPGFEVQRVSKLFADHGFGHVKVGSLDLLDGNVGARLASGPEARESFSSVYDEAAADTSSINPQPTYFKRLEMAARLANLSGFLNENLILQLDQNRPMSLNDFNNLRAQFSKSEASGTFSHIDAQGRADYFLYTKRQHQFMDEGQAGKGLLVARWLTARGILNPDTKWGVHQLADGRYQLFAISPRIQAFGRPEEGEDKGWESKLSSIDDVFIELMERVEPTAAQIIGEMQADPDKQYPADSPMNLVNLVEMSHPDNWGIKNGTLYPIDVEVIDFGQFNASNSMDRIVNLEGPVDGGASDVPNAARLAGKIKAYERGEKLALYSGLQKLLSGLSVSVEDPVSKLREEITSKIADEVVSEGSTAQKSIDEFLKEESEEWFGLYQRLKEMLPGRTSSDRGRLERAIEHAHEVWDRIYETQYLITRLTGSSWTIATNETLPALHRSGIDYLVPYGERSRENVEAEELAYQLILMNGRDSQIEEMAILLKRLRLTAVEHVPEKILDRAGQAWQPDFSGVNNEHDSDLVPAARSSLARLYGIIETNRDVSKMNDIFRKLANPAGVLPYYPDRYAPYLARLVASIGRIEDAARRNKYANEDQKRLLDKFVRTELHYDWYLGRSTVFEDAIERLADIIVGWVDSGGDAKTAAALIEQGLRLIAVIAEHPVDGGKREYLSESDLQEALTDLATLAAERSFAVEGRNYRVDGLKSLVGNAANTAEGKNAALVIDASDAITGQKKQYLFKHVLETGYYDEIATRICALLGLKAYRVERYAPSGGERRARNVWQIIEWIDSDAVSQTVSMPDGLRNRIDVYQPDQGQKIIAEWKGSDPDRAARAMREFGSILAVEYLLGAMDAKMKHVLMAKEDGRLFRIDWEFLFNNKRGWIVPGVLEGDEKDFVNQIGLKEEVKAGFIATWNQIQSRRAEILAVLSDVSAVPAEVEQVIQNLGRPGATVTAQLGLDAPSMPANVGARFAGEVSHDQLLSVVGPRLDAKLRQMNGGRALTRITIGPGSTVDKFKDLANVFEKNSRNIDDREKVALTLIAGTSPWIEHRLIVDDYGRLRDNAVNLLRGKVGLMAHDLIVDFSVFPGTRSVHVDNISVGSALTAESLQGAGYGSEVFSGLVRELERAYPGWSVSTVAIGLNADQNRTEFVSKKFMQYFDAHRTNAVELMKVNPNFNPYNVDPPDKDKVMIGVIGRRGADPESVLEGDSLSDDSPTLLDLQGPQAARLAGTAAEADQGFSVKINVDGLDREYVRGAKPVNEGAEAKVYVFVPVVGDGEDAGLTENRSLAAVVEKENWSSFDRRIRAFEVIAQLPENERKHFPEVILIDRDHRIDKEKRAIVMEYLSNEGFVNSAADLKRVLSRVDSEGNVTERSVEEKMMLLLSLVEGLKILSDHQLIFGDLKFPNIHLDDELLDPSIPWSQELFLRHPVKLVDMGGAIEKDGVDSVSLSTVAAPMNAGLRPLDEEEYKNLKGSYQDEKGHRRDEKGEWLSDFMSRFRSQEANKFSLGLMALQTFLPDKYDEIHGFLNHRQLEEHMNAVEEILRAAHPATSDLGDGELTAPWAAILRKLVNPEAYFRPANPLETAEDIPTIDLIESTLREYVNQAQSQLAYGSRLADPAMEVERLIDQLSDQYVVLADPVKKKRLFGRGFLYKALQNARAAADAMDRGDRGEVKTGRWYAKLDQAIRDTAPEDWRALDDKGFYQLVLLAALQLEGLENETLDIRARRAWAVYQAVVKEQNLSSGYPYWHAFMTLYAVYANPGIIDRDPGAESKAELSAGSEANPIDSVVIPKVFKKPIADDALNNFNTSLMDLFRQVRPSRADGVSMTPAQRYRTFRSRLLLTPWLAGRYSDAVMTRFTSDRILGQSDYPGMYALSSPDRVNFYIKKESDINDAIKEDPGAHIYEEGNQFLASEPDSALRVVVRSQVYETSGVFELGVPFVSVGRFGEIMPSSYTVTSVLDASDAKVGYPNLIQTPLSGEWPALTGVAPGFYTLDEARRLADDLLAQLEERSSNSARDDLNQMTEEQDYANRGYATVYVGTPESYVSRLAVRRDLPRSFIENVLQNNARFFTAKIDEEGRFGSDRIIALVKPGVLEAAYEGLKATGDKYARSKADAMNELRSYLSSLKSDVLDKLNAEIGTDTQSPLVAAYSEFMEKDEVRSLLDSEIKNRSAQQKPAGPAASYQKVLADAGYRLKVPANMIGRGATANVFEAEKDGKKYAVKIPKVYGNKKIREWFNRETEIGIAAMEKGLPVPRYYSGVDGIVVMDMVRGVTLTDALAMSVPNSRMPLITQAQVNEAVEDIASQFKAKGLPFKDHEANDGNFMLVLDELGNPVLENGKPRVLAIDLAVSMGNGTQAPAAAGVQRGARLAGETELVRLAEFLQIVRILELGRTDRIGSGEAQRRFDAGRAGLEAILAMIGDPRRRVLENGGEYPLLAAEAELLLTVMGGEGIYYGEQRLWTPERADLTPIAAAEKRLILPGESIAPQSDMEVRREIGSWMSYARLLAGKDPSGASEVLLTLPGNTDQEVLSLLRRIFVDTQKDGGPLTLHIELVSSAEEIKSIRSQYPNAKYGGFFSNNDLKNAAYQAEIRGGIPLGFAEDQAANLQLDYGRHIPALVALVLLSAQKVPDVQRFKEQLFVKRSPILMMDNAALRSLLDVLDQAKQILTALNFLLKPDITRTILIQKLRDLEAVASMA